MNVYAQVEVCFVVGVTEFIMNVFLGKCLILLFDMISHFMKRMSFKGMLLHGSEWR